MNRLLSLLRRLATYILPEPQLRGLRTLWHRVRSLDPRRLRLRHTYYRLNAEAAADEIVLRPGLRLAIHDQARESFEWFCFRSPEMVAELDGFLARGANCLRLLDVGACHGLFSLAFTQDRIERKALAIEPSPLAWDVLVSNIRKNAKARVIPVQAAVGAKPRTLRMRFNWHHLEASPESLDDPTSVSVSLRTLDDICNELAFRPDILKIDVEGYEIFALRGARRILAEDRPILFLEAHPQKLRELGGSMQELWKLITELGYRALELNGKPVYAGKFTALASVSRFYFEPTSLPVK